MAWGVQRPYRDLPSTLGGHTSHPLQRYGLDLEPCPRFAGKRWRRNCLSFGGGGPYVRILLPNVRSVLCYIRALHNPTNYPSYTHHPRGRQDSVWGSSLSPSFQFTHRYAHICERGTAYQLSSSTWIIDSSLSYNGPWVWALTALCPPPTHPPFYRGGFGSEGENRPRATIIALALSRSLSTSFAL